MTNRLNVVEELKLSFEVPYVTDRGDVIDCLNVTVNECRHGIDISYALLEPTPDNLDSLFPPEGVDVLALNARRILHDLEVKPQRLILQLWEFGLNGRTFSVEGRAPVSKSRDIVLLMLTKTPFVYKFGYNLMLWHQSCHAKDRWEYRFPSAHPLVQVGAWHDALWHFSIDGRLEKWGRPHYSRDERLAEAARVFEESAGCARLDAVELAGRLCGDLWGREVTQAELMAVAVEAGLGSASPRQD